jgi:hypothetical protein
MQLPYGEVVATRTGLEPWGFGGAAGTSFSEMYRDGDGAPASAYDGLNRLQGMNRGTLTVTESD